MIDPNVVFDKLAGFQTADELADYFKSENIQGHMQVETQCPIAMYFYRHTQKKLVSVGEKVAIASEYWTGTVDVASGRWIDNGWEKECSEVMKEFIRRFDDSEYPELVVCVEDEGCCCFTCRPEYYKY